MTSEETTHFGFRDVPLARKQGLVDDVFHKVADRYDLMNDLMSAGMHRLWKDALISMLRPPHHHAFHHLDVAGGTGDIAFRVLQAGGPRTAVTILDINGDMLRVGRERAGDKYGERLRFVQGNAETLPLPSSTYDAYTIAFGIRNVPDIPAALREAYRVLRRGGRFLCLEFSRVDVPLLDAFYDAYSFNVIPGLGRLVTGDGEPYRYLVESIRKFPTPDAFTDMITEAGFARASYRPLSGGIVAIHSGWKV
ncbi:bifunctional demethylmenaquinone methyltransferase/2-methoxy-6-polyprenyl-1,4-benzoquinol methylase UbiE [Pseudochelatococcus contaminans]|uniref:Ubiquinone/menaquinone biosynthesis C-methyltransferase UbiE n=1 Tax=Pseudochelatococcus contaminans TaxID=1538103 RepID=A0A7W5Z5Q7_9HYPH|nr:bifunctional demethylmenaquinone methyltransferase/2-methoxy-6-polyprenyl-1,4-benzoquinol methylase UbiE [Pseudochelatococcus contaminans]MBB3810189.1 demethylmenaquinone methyltransferase/2-methoxy-6-polyprenyl-1,4-benzoquinol methylase [Pseudochelatococcus contaminans]